MADPTYVELMDIVRALAEVDLVCTSLESFCLCCGAYTYPCEPVEHAPGCAWIRAREVLGIYTEPRRSRLLGLDADA